MAILLLLLAALLGAWVGTAALLLWRHRMPALRRRVLVNCDNDGAVRGILTGVHPDWLVLQQADLLSPETQPAKLDGETFVPRSRVLFMQVLP